MNKLLLALPFLFLLGSKKKGAPNANRPVNPPPQGQDPRRGGERKGRPNIPIKQGDPIALQQLRYFIRDAISSTRFDATNRGHLHDALLALNENPVNAADAALALSALDERQRKAYAETKARSYYVLGQGAARPVAIGAWLYMHLMGKDISQLATAQKQMGITPTGEIDEETLQAIRDLTGFEIWSLALANILSQEEAPSPAPRREPPKASSTKLPRAKVSPPAEKPAPRRELEDEVEDEDEEEDNGEDIEDENGDEASPAPETPVAQIKRPANFKPKFKISLEPTSIEIFEGKKELGVGDHVVIEEDVVGPMGVVIMVPAELDDQGRVLRYFGDVTVPPKNALWLKGEPVDFAPRHIIKVFDLTV